jgi:hypothetical protein
MANIINRIFHGHRIVITHLDNIFWVLLDNIFFVDLSGDVVNVFCAISRANKTKKHITYQKKST